ncbi:MAG: hypothetical protein AB7E47_15530 [Desulfovibrionaceae bacterium]
MLEYYKYKEVYDLFVQGKFDDAKRLLSHLQQRYIETCDESTVLKTQIQEYEDILYLAKNLVHDGDHYWLMTGSIKQGPFCQHCYDQNGQLIRLSEHGSSLKCFVCGSHYAVEDNRPDPVMAMRQERKPTSNKVIPLYK